MLFMCTMTGRSDSVFDTRYLLSRTNFSFWICMWKITHHHRCRNFAKDADLRVPKFLHLLTLKSWLRPACGCHAKLLISVSTNAHLASFRVSTAHAAPVCWESHVNPLSSAMKSADFVLAFAATYIENWFHSSYQQCHLSSHFHLLPMLDVAGAWE